MKLTDEQIKEGFATLGKNNAEALKKACESITKRTKDFFDKAKKKK
jgi:DNA-directed RNA polymerase subunit L